MTQTDALRTRILTSFGRQGLMTTLGATVLTVEPGAVTIRVPVTSAASQQKGYAHGALAFAIGDSAAGYSAVSLLEPGMDVVTSEMTIHYLSPGVGEVLVARGQVIKPGRRMLVTQADVYAVSGDEERHIARLTGTMVAVSEA